MPLDDLIRKVGALGVGMGAAADHTERLKRAADGVNAIHTEKSAAGADTGPAGAGGNQVGIGITGPNSDPSTNAFNTNQHPSGGANNAGAGGGASKSTTSRAGSPHYDGSGVCDGIWAPDSKSVIPGYGEIERGRLVRVMANDRKTVLWAVNDNQNLGGEVSSSGNSRTFDTGPSGYSAPTGGTDPTLTNSHGSSIAATSQQQLTEAQKQTLLLAQIASNMSRSTSIKSPADIY